MPRTKKTEADPKVEKKKAPAAKKNTVKATAKSAKSENNKEAKKTTAKAAATKGKAKAATKKAETAKTAPVQEKTAAAAKPKTTAKRGRRKKTEPVKPKPQAHAAPAKKKTEVPHAVKDPQVRYSDEDLEFFKNRILDLRHEAIEELRMLRERLDDLTEFNFAEESMIYSMHMAEQGSEALEKEKTYAQIQRINEYIKKLDEALLRIKEKTYGICRVCGILISKERLWAVPVTTLSASYKVHNKCPEDGVDRIEPLKR